jgi:hypothetical protein
MRLMNLQGLFLGPRRLAPRHCEREGCHQATREGKAFCSDHVEEHPYVRDLMARLAEREAQDDLVSKRGAKAVDLESSITVQEILQHLDFHGARTEERLCRELNLDTRTLHGYVQALRRRRLVTLGTTKRGSTLVKPLRQKPAAAPVVAAAPLQPESIETRRTG